MGIRKLAVGPEGRHGLVFLTGILAICAASWLILLRPDNGRVLELGVTLDLTVSIPALYWFVMVRGRGWPLVSVLPVFFASLILASLILPEGRQSALHTVKYLVAAPAELALLGLLVHRAGKAIRAGRATGSMDTLEQIRSAVTAIIPSERAAGIMAFEASVLWYALFSWRSKPPAVAEQCSTYTHHRKAGYASVVVVILLAIAVEITPVHALLARWSASVAWIVTALSLYSALWVIGDFRAFALQSTSLDADRLRIRFGLRWRLNIPRAQIESIRVIGGSAALDRVDLRMALPGAKRVSIRLTKPVVALGPYGRRRSVQALELGLDDPEALQTRLRLAQPS